MTQEELQGWLDREDDGILRSGAHQAGSRQFCALEFDSVVRGRDWSDTPITLPDLRPLNDGPWRSDAARTAALLPVMVALWDWSTWTRARQRQWASSVALETVKQIIADLPGLPNPIRLQCQRATTLAEATAAAGAVGAAAAWWAARAAGAAARAAAAETPLRVACQIWIDAAVATADL